MTTSRPNVPMRARILAAEPREELLGGPAQQRQVALHAARHVEHHDEPNRLRGVVEDRDRLRLAVVAHLEVVTRQRGDEPPVAVGDGDEDPNQVALAAKGWRLLGPVGQERGRAQAQGSGCNHRIG